MAEANSGESEEMLCGHHAEIQGYLHYQGSPPTFEMKLYVRSGMLHKEITVESCSPWVAPALYVSKKSFRRVDEVRTDQLVQLYIKQSGYLAIQSGTHATTRKSDLFFTRSS
ncbi:hypothetical protein EMCRGX_G012951 [Ephydatia muelleri]|eukprot:Em0004g554a